MNNYAKQLRQCTEDLRKTAAEEQWQAHYEAALSVCRLSRRVRFRLADLDLGEYDFRSIVQTLLSEARDEIRTDDQVQGVKYTIKRLDDIRDNVCHRLGSIDDDRTSFLDD